jgi:type I restriction enzyme R subunit
LNKEDETNITDHLSHLPDVTEGGEESAKRFDILMLNMALYYLLEDPRWQVNVSKLIRIGNALLKKVIIPVIAKQEKLIKEFIREEFWKIANVKRIEQIRISIRELVKFLDKESASDVYTTFEDHLDEANIKEFDLVKSYQSAKAYRERVEAFIRKNRNHLTIDKLYRNLPLTPADVKQLEEFLFDGDQRGTKEELEKELKGQSLGAFIRSIIGLDMIAIQKQFADFLRQGSYSPNQIRFINVIVDYLAKNGTLNKELLFEPPYTDIHQDGLFGVFEDGDVRKVISIVDTINGNANVG